MFFVVGKLNVHKDYCLAHGTKMYDIYNNPTQISNVTKQKKTWDAEV